MSVHPYETANGPAFRVKWRAGGRQHSKSFHSRDFGGGARGEKAAGRAASAWDTEVRQQLVTTGVVVQARGAALLRDAWMAWFDEGAGRWSDATQETYASALDAHILPRLGHLQLAAMKPATIEKWNHDLQKAGVGPSAIQKANTVLSSLLSYCARADLIDTNPSHVARKPAAPRERTPLKITPMQVEQLRAWFIERDLHGDATLISILAYAGLRPESEALVLDWLAVGPKLLTVKPNRKKGAKERHVALLDPLAADLKAWRRRSGRIGGLIVPHGAGGVSGFGEAWSTNDWNNWRGKWWVADKTKPDERRPRGRWAQACSDVGLPSHAIPRDLRGSFASLLIWEGRSVVDVARQLGHKASMCLDTYAGEFEAFDPVERKPANQVIAEAREAVHGPARRQA